MSSWNNIRIGPKLQATFLLMVGFAGVIGVAAIVQISQVAHDADLIATQALGSVYRVSSIGANAAQSRSAALEVLTQLQLNYSGGAEGSNRALTQAEHDLQGNVKAYEPLIRTPEQRSLWDEASRKWQEYKKEQDRAIAIAQDGLAGDAQKILIGLAEEKFQRYTAALQKLMDFSNAEADRAKLAADEAAARARHVIFVLLALNAGIGSAIALSMTRAITRPLQHTVALLRHIGSGRLDNRIDASRRDEIGQLLAGLATTQTQLLERTLADQRRAEEDRQRAVADRQALEEVQQIVAAVVDGHLDRRISLTGKSGFALQLAESVNRLVDNVSAVVDGVGHLVASANAGDLTKRITLNSGTGLEKSIGSGVNNLVAELAAIVVKVKAAAESVAARAAEISEGSLSLSNRTMEQASSLEETAASMEEMTSTVRQNADNARQANELAIDARRRAENGHTVVGNAIETMAGINAASRKIADIIGVIDEIAFQTNLLALNAAVEAARAGEQGRGFAVVANEVRTLASRSAAAAKEIKALIKDSVARVAEGERVVGETGATFEQVVVAVKKVGNIISEIAAASSEQASGIDQIGVAITKMDRLTQENSGLVEDTASASRVLADESRNLNDVMSRYRVGTADGHSTPVRVESAVGSRAAHAA